MSTWVGEAEVLAVDAEAVQMLILPAHGDLKDLVQVSQGGVFVHKHPLPDLRADAAQDKLKLVDLHGLSGSRLRGYPSESYPRKTGAPPGN
nr:hypothetical protein [Gloeobacter morelensis]